MTTTHKVEIAFATDPDAPPTWTDVTAYVWAAAGGQVVINRGRSDQVSSITPSQLTLTLDNHDGRFTAGYTGGAYYPNVVLGKRIRISTSTGAGFTERFTGYVNAWPVQWAPSGRYAEAQITAVDRLARLGRQISGDNLISTYYNLYSPTDYWMLAESAGTVVPYNRAGPTILHQGSKFTFPDSQTLYDVGAGDGPGYDGLSAIRITNGSLGTTASPTYVFSETQSLTLAGFLRCEKNAGDASPSSLILNLQSLSDSSFISIGSIITGFFAIVSNSGGAGPTVIGTTNPYDGATHHVCGVFQGLGVGSGGNVLLYVDGVLQASSTITTAQLAGGITVRVVCAAQSSDTFGVASTYTYAHAAIFPTAIGATQVADLAAAGLTAFSGETTLARTTRLATLAGINPVVIGSSGTTSMSPLTDVNGADYLSLMQATADTEGGLLFVECDGGVRLRTRRDMQNQTTKWTLTTGQYGTDISFLLDDFGVVNDVVADRPNGNPYHVTNSTSVTANGTYSLSKTLLTTNDYEVQDFSNWTLATSAPTVRCDQVSVNLLTQPSLVATWLTVELGDVIACTGLPSSSAPASSVTMQVQGWTETIALDTYMVSMNTVPYDAGSVFTLNDATFGKLNGPGLLGY